MPELTSTHMSGWAKRDSIRYSADALAGPVCAYMRRNVSCTGHPMQGGTGAAKPSCAVFFGRLRA